MRIHIVVDLPYPCPRCEPDMHDSRDIINRINEMERKIMKTVADLTAAVTKLTTVTQSLLASYNGLADLIRALPANAQAISDLADQVDADAANMAAAVAANTDLTPTTPAP